MPTARALRSGITYLSLLSRVMLIVLVALLPAFGMEVYNQLALRAAQQAELRDEALRQARTVAGEVHRVLDSTRHALLALAATPAITAMNRADCDRELHAVGLHLDFIRVLALVGPDDRLVCSNAPGSVQGHFAADWPPVTAARRRGDFAAAGFLLGKWTHAPLLATAYPLPPPEADSAEVTGAAPDAHAPVLVANIDLGWLAREMKSLAVQGGSNITLVDRSGTILVAVPDGPPPGTPLPAGERFWLRATEPEVWQGTGDGRGGRIVGIAPLADAVVAVDLNRSTAAAAQERAARRSYIVSAACLLAALTLAGTLAQRTISGPVNRILRTVGRWREGDMSARVAPTDLRSEFGRIGGALDELFAAVERTESGLRTAKAELERRVAERTRRLVAEVQEREAVQAELLQAQKMEVIGRLTGGVAHDFNNLLTAVMGNLELAMLRSRDRPDLKRLLDGALRAAERGASLTQRMLAFGRRQFLQLRPVQVGELLEGMRDLLERTIGPQVRVEVVGAPALWPALADPNQLELVILNLAINARDAMPDGGTLLISADQETVVAGLSHPAQLAPGDYVRIALRDHGIGIDPELLPRVLEPFFTTKPAGKGSGLGLSMAQGVAMQSGGGLAIESALGAGTTVSVWLPRAPGGAEPSAEPPPRAAPAPGRAGPGASILLVDDDPDVAEISAQLLGAEGYAVTRSQSGAAALALLDQGLAPDLLIADLAMPGISGLRLAALARARRPGLPVLLATGYVNDDPEAGFGGAENPGYPVLEKPFRADALLAAVRALLPPSDAPDARPGSGS